jgi:cell shape-determining protein MreC|tara:strand:+ start:125 stop:391 length:267 start_codon:yes stop_codon:yes gene_type:complete
LTDGSGQIIVTAMNKVSEKELLASVEKLEIKISQLIQEKEKLSSENQTLSKKNEELIQAVQSLESLKDQARVKAENVLRRLDEIEPLA